jgi:plasmid stabilization system protein ParE
VTEYRLTEIALDDLRRILDYLEAQRPSAALRYAIRFEQIFANLADYPYSGRPRFGLSSDLRSFAEKPYIVFYRPLPSGVIIRRLLHSAQDITPDFFTSPE